MKALKRCACGRSYDVARWLALPRVGHQPTVRGLGLELRNCACGSTISVDVEELERATGLRLARAALQFALGRVG